MNRYNKKELDIKVEDLPFQDFLTSRYSMTARVNAQKTYEYSKENNIPFFNMTTACILEKINEIPEFKRRIIENKVYEYEKKCSKSYNAGRPYNTRNRNITCIRT